MPSNAAVRNRYFANRFVDRLRTEFVVDETEWGELLAILRDLAAEWHDRNEIDKDLAQDLFVLARIIRTSGEGIRDTDPELAIDLLNRGEEVNALVVEALG